MIHMLDPDGTVSEMTVNHVCPYHKLNPGGQWAGCTCSATYSQRAATPEERIKNKENRLKREQAHGIAMQALFGHDEVEP